MYELAHRDPDRRAIGNGDRKRIGDPDGGS
jgi:hypothetical protein